VTTSRKILWHYTDTAGFHGIIRSNRLRLGDARFLNDRTERQYGISIVMQVIADELKRGQDHFLAFTAHYLKRRETHAVHVCSFSEVSNSISQWQRYGADGYGYCLGFSPASLRRLKTTELQLKRVVYKPRRQRELVRTRLETFREAFRIAAEDRDESMPMDVLLGTSAALAAMVLDGIALELKDSSFSDEREWRLIHRTLSDAKRTGISQDVEFTPRGHFVKPFIEIALPKGPKGRSPLAAVVCGPRSDGSLAVETASYFLRATGHAVEASWSELQKVWR
jgi:hypothetical protein